MANDDPLRPHRRVMRKLVYRFLTSILIAMFILPAWGADKSKDEETLKNAATILQGMIDSKNVPPDVLVRADCVIILPNVKKVGLGIGGSGGRGPMTCRTGKNFSGKWSAPAMYTVGGASFGLQVGGSSTDFVLLIMSQRGVDAILQGKTKLGRDATAAAGPSGATSAGTVGGTDVITYGRASGLFAGMSLGGASLQADDDANQRLYGEAMSAKEIVLKDSAKATPGGKVLVSVLDTNVAKHGS